MIGKLPTREEIFYMRADLTAFDDPNGVIDDPEEYLDRIPYYLETILAQHKEIERLRNKYES